jgi:chromosome segregation ATPase
MSLTPVTLLGVLVAGIVTLGALVFLFALAGRKAAENAPHPSEMDSTGRKLLSSIETLRASLADLAANLRNVPELRGLLEEIDRASGHAGEQAARLLRARSALQQTLRGRATALQQLGSLERQLAAETDPGAMASLKSALEARQVEVAGYRNVEDKIRGIEAKLREAEAGLAELNARLVTATAQRAGDADPSDELGGLAQRLRTLGTTLEEATQLLESGA